MGTAYFDLFPRPRQVPALRAISRRARRWRHADGTRELPWTAIVGNWPAPGGRDPSLLTHTDVVVLFHEFGHAMARSSLDRSPYVTLGERRLRQDFVEAPSQMLENWMWEPGVLARDLEALRDGQAAPRLADSSGCSRSSTSATATTGARRRSTRRTTWRSTPRNRRIDPTRLWYKLFHRSCRSPRSRAPRPEASFGHLMGGYDAGYYGYSLVEGVRAGSVHAVRAGGDPRSEGRTRVPRRRPRARGTEEPGMLVQRFLGRPVNDSAFYRELGISRGVSETP